MSDLISRKAVYEMLHGLGGCDATDEWADGWDKGINQAISDLDDIPVAYDVDKVVEQLRAEKNMDRSKIYSSTQCDAIKHTFGMAVDIVKGAVKNG